jgi:uncharacterized protein (DUF885 family)
MSSFLIDRRAIMAGLAATPALWIVQGRSAHAAAGGEDSAIEAAFLAFLEASWQADLVRSPEQRTLMGLPGPHDGWTLADAGYEQESLRLASQALARLANYPLAALSPASRISHMMFADANNATVADYTWRHHLYAISHLDGVYNDIPNLLIGAHAIKQEEDALDYVARLRQAAIVLDIAGEQMREQAALGILPPTFSFPRILKACRAVISGAPFPGPSGADSPLLADLKGKLASLAIPEARKRDILSKAAQALLQQLGPAYQRLIETVTTMGARQKASHGIWALPDGQRFYDYRIRIHTGLELTAERIHGIGLAEVARLHDELREVMGKIGFKGDLRAFFQHLRTDPAQGFTNDEKGRQEFLQVARGYISAMEEKLPDYFGILPQSKVQVKPVEPYREATTAGAFYESGSPDGSRPGVFYANLSQMAAQSRYDLEALCYHEASPGHHMQTSIAQEMKSLPSFRQYLWDNAYGEGWAMYSERFALETGAYQAPYSQAGRIISELFRAARLVVDTGIHAQRWTREQAIQWMNDNTGNTVADNENEVERYFVWPGQALGYKIGMNHILDLREKAKAALGPRFDIKGFHDTVLGNGAVTLPVLTIVVQQWIDGRKAA